MSERRRVNFRESPPSSGTSSRYTSDSGHGSVSDYPGSSAAGGVASSSTASSRYSAAGSISVNQWTDLTALQEAYRTVLVERDDWRTRTEELEAELSQAQKVSSEAEAKWRAMVDRNEQIEDEKKKLFKENKILKPQVEEVDELRDKVDELREELADANARFNEMQLNMAPAYGTPGTSPHHNPGLHGHAEAKSSSTSRHSREGKASSSSTKSGSNTGSGTSSGGSSHSSSRAKVGSSSSTSTAKLSRSGSRHDHEKNQKMRLSQRFDQKDDGVNDSNASASSSSQKHHKSGSSGNGSSGSNGSSASADSGVRPPPRLGRQTYVEGFGPAAPQASSGSSSQRPATMAQTPVSPNKGIQRSAPPPSVMAAAASGSGVPSSAAYYARSGYAPPLQPPHQFGARPPTALMSPRGDMSKDSGRPIVQIVGEAVLDPYQDGTYYSGYAAPRDPRHPRR